MKSDPFQIMATIKRLERERDTITFGGFAAYLLIAWWNSASITTGESLIFGAVGIVGILVFREAKDAHLQSLRVSLRHLEILRDPNIINGSD